MRFETMNEALKGSPTGEAFLVINPDETEVWFDRWMEAEQYRHETYRAPKPVKVALELSVEDQEARYKAQCERLQRARAARKQYAMAGPAPVQQEIHGEELGQLQLVAL